MGGQDADAPENSRRGADGQVAGGGQERIQPVAHSTADQQHEAPQSAARQTAHSGGKQREADQVGQQMQEPGMQEQGGHAAVKLSADDGLRGGAILAQERRVGVIQTERQVAPQQKQGRRDAGHGLASSGFR
jgi:hypothetical protein